MGIYFSIFKKLDRGWGQGSSGRVLGKALGSILVSPKKKKEH
jgi:hypothetical protein